MTYQCKKCEDTGTELTSVCCVADVVINKGGHYVCTECNEICELNKCDECKGKSDYMRTDIREDEAMEANHNKSNQ